MLKRIAELLKPKTASLGFTKEELDTVCTSIAGRLDNKEDATDEQINAEIEAVLPFLKLSQSATSRIVNESIKKWQEQNPKQKEETEPTNPTNPNKEEPKTEPTNEEEKEVPDYVKKIMQGFETLEAKLTALEKEKTHNSLSEYVKNELKDVDADYYSLALQGKQFSTQEEADQFITGVKEGYEAFSKKYNLEQLKNLTPPGGGGGADKKVSSVMQERIDARKKEQENPVIPSTPPIMGLPK